MTADPQTLGESLGPVLIAQCQGRLGAIDWFRTSHQHSSSATGFSVWREGDGSPQPVIVKLPVGPAEHRWTSTMGTHEKHWGDPESAALPSVRVVASGERVGEVDCPWIVMERLVGPPMSSHIDQTCLHDLIATVADFQHRAARLTPIEGRPRTPDWEKLLERARDVARRDALPESHRWGDAIRKVQKTLPLLASAWDRRALNSWCHGDVHPGNVMRRSAHGGVGRWVLVDLALVHPGHWVEDALYLERQFWAHPEFIQGVKPISELAKHRRERGLDANDNYAEIANVRRVLMAACAPAVMETEGRSPKYLHAALEIIEKTLPQVVHH